MASYTQLHQKKGATAVKFHISCADCGFEQRTGRPLELGIYGADQVCDRTVLVLNGRKLTQAWNDSHGYGSGLNPSHIEIGDGVLAATWQSACISSGSSSDEPIRHFLTVQIDRVAGFDARDNLGFTVLLTLAERPEILCLRAKPWTPSVEVTLIDQWMDFEAYKCLEAQPDTSHADEDQPKEDLRWCWGLLQDLKAKSQRSQQETKQERKDIRKTLPHDCTGSQTAWRDCRSLRCKIKASYMYVPAAIRRVIYRSGPFPPPLPGTSGVVNILKSLPYRRRQNNM